MVSISVMCCTRVLLVPQSISSINRPYHFFISYFVPAVGWLVENEDNLLGKEILLETPTDPSLRDWLSIIPDGFKNLTFRFITSEQALRMATRSKSIRYGFAARLAVQHLGLRDKPDGLFSRETERSMRRLDVFVNRLELPRLSHKDVVLVARLSNHQKRKLPRTIPNLDEVSHDLKVKGFSCEIVDFAVEKPVKAIARVQNCNYLVGQHGAGLAHLIWAPPGLISVIEIRGPLSELPFVPWVYEHLARARGVAFRDVMAQRSWIGALNSNKLIASLTKLDKPSKKTRALHLDKASHAWELLVAGKNLIQSWMGLQPGKVRKFDNN